MVLKFKKYQTMNTMRQCASNKPPTSCLRPQTDVYTRLPTVAENYNGNPSFNNLSNLNENFTQYCTPKNNTCIPISTPGNHDKVPPTSTQWYMRQQGCYPHFVESKGITYWNPMHDVGITSECSDHGWSWARGYDHDQGIKECNKVYNNLNMPFSNNYLCGPPERKETGGTDNGPWWSCTRSDTKCEMP